MRRPSTPYLSEKERGIVSLLVQGVTLKEAAQQAYISYATAKQYMHHARVTSRMRTTFQLVALLAAEKI